MTEDIEIESAGRQISSISFVRSPQHLQATRTASGFEILVPIVLTLRTLSQSEPRLVVSNLRGNFL